MIYLLRTRYWSLSSTITLLYQYQDKNFIQECKIFILVLIFGIDVQVQTFIGDSMNVDSFKLSTYRTRQRVSHMEQLLHWLRIIKNRSSFTCPMRSLMQISTHFLCVLLLDSDELPCQIFCFFIGVNIIVDSFINVP